MLYMNDNVTIRALPHSQIHQTHTWFSMKEALKERVCMCVWVLWCSLCVCLCACEYVDIHGKSVWKTLCSDNQALVTGQHVYFINESRHMCVCKYETVFLFRRCVCRWIYETLHNKLHTLSWLVENEGTELLLFLFIKVEIKLNADMRHYCWVLIQCLTGLFTQNENSCWTPVWLAFFCGTYTYIHTYIERVRDGWMDGKRFE